MLNDPVHGADAAVAPGPIAVGHPKAFVAILDVGMELHPHTDTGSPALMSKACAPVSPLTGVGVTIVTVIVPVPVVGVAVGVEV